MQVVARITLRQWAESRGFPLSTVTRWRHRADDFPPHIEQIGLTYRYDDRALDRWKGKHPELGQGRRHEVEAAAEGRRG